MSTKLITFETELEGVKSIPPAILKKFKKLGIETVRDLLWHIPSRYEDFSKVSKIKDLKPGELVTIRAEVKKVNSRRSFRSRLFVTDVLVTDETGGVNLVWFNQPYITNVLKEGMWVNFAGKVFYNKMGLHISNPSYELLRGTAVTTHTACLVPVYPETRGLNSKTIRQYIKTFLDVLKDLDDFLPSEVLKKQKIPVLFTALNNLHFPKTAEQAKAAKRRFAFDYIFLIQLSNLKARQALSKEKAPSLKLTKTKLNELLSELPFKLTTSQDMSLTEILSDLKNTHPMNRLLQGDVGSGKTAVAALAALVCVHSDKQAVFMAPTEVLTRQHYQTLTGMFSNIPGGVALLTGSESRVYYEKNLEQKKTKVSLKSLIESGKVKTIIGTHALISGGLKIPDLGLVIIDEQHRFGVRQRSALIGAKKKILPHFLSMSATPIPRTLSLAIFGDLDVSTINELPKGRKPIITKIVDPENRMKAYGFIKQQIEKGRQVFFIYPRINASEQKDTEDKRSSAWVGVKNVTEEFELLQKIFPKFKVDMLHGKLKPKEKELVMKKFKDGKTNILVSTSVIEVGVDIPNATIMVIEGAERFGLAQLYQFRGRVGRGEHQSFCFLFTDSHSVTTHQRLQALIKAKNGFELAEKDLEIRGPGQFLGDKQTGLPDLAMNSLNDIRLVKSARDTALMILEKDPELENYPLLLNKLNGLGSEIHLE